MTDRTLQRMIFAACRTLGLDTETRHDLQLRATGKASLSDMSEAEQRKVLDALKELGFKTETKGKRPTASRPDVRYLHVLWRLLGEAGVAKQAGSAGLNAFVRSRFEQHWGAVPIDIDQMTDAAQINDVTRALRKMCQRAGVEVDR